MRERKILYLLVLTAVLGIGVTFCTSRFLSPETDHAEESFSGPAEAAVAMKRAADIPPSAAEAGAAPPEAEVKIDQPEAAAKTDQPETGVEIAFPEAAAEISLPETTVAITPLETAAAADGQGETQPAAAGDGAGENTYRVRLEELDARIQKTREGRDSSVSRNSGGAASSKSQAEDELWLWNNELQIIYNEILDRLGGDQAEALAAAQREWYKSRDAEAVAAAQSSSGGALESVEYTSSLAASTRERAYELVSLYENILTD